MEPNLLKPFSWLPDSAVLFDDAGRRTFWNSGQRSASFPNAILVPRRHSYARLSRFRAAESEQLAETIQTGASPRKPSHHCWIAPRAIIGSPMRPCCDQVDVES